MGCPAEVEIGDNLTFSVNTHTFGTGAATDADAVPSWRLYEDETGAAILNGDMAKLDDANTTGLYSELVACTSGNGFENGKSYTIYIEAVVDGVTASRSFGFKAYDERKADAVKVSGDSTAANNLELQYDATGLSGNTFPATQAQVEGIANVGAAVKLPVIDAPDGFVITNGTNEQGDEDRTQAADGVVHQISKDGGSILDVYYIFDIGGARVPVSVTILGRVQTVNDDLAVFVNTGTIASPNWIQRDTLPGQATAVNETHIFDLFLNDIMTGADAGKVALRFQGTGLNTGTLSIDQMFIATSQSVSSTGYSNGSIYINTLGSNTNTVPDVDGTADNPVSTLAAALTLNGSLGLNKFHIANGSLIELTAAGADNLTFVGHTWTLDLAGKSIDGAHFENANVTGTGTNGSQEPSFEGCHMGDVTIPPSHLCICGLEGTLAAGSAGDFFLDRCHSGIAGTDTPVFDFGAGLNASQVSVAGYYGGIHIHNMGAGSGTYNMSLRGGGNLIINANCSGGTIVVAGEFTRTNNSSGAVTLVDDARIDVGQILNAVTDDGTPIDGSSVNAVEAKVDTIAVDVAGLDGDAMVGTDNAALASVCTEPRLAELDAAKLPLDIGVVRAQVPSSIGSTAGGVSTGTEVDGGHGTTGVESGLYWQGEPAGSQDGEGLGLVMEQVFALGTSKISTVAIKAKETLDGVVHVWAWDYTADTPAFEQISTDDNAISGADDTWYSYALGRRHRDPNGAARVRCTSTSITGGTYLFVNFVAVTGVGTGVSVSEIVGVAGDGLTAIVGADGDTLETISDQIDAVPTAAENTDEWESQSQADPTGFHANVKEVDGTAQTANDNGADINTLITQVGTAGDGLTDLGGMSTTMKGQVESEANDALVAQKLDHLVAVADDDDPADDSIVAKLAASDGDWSGFDEATDSLEAIRDRGDAAWSSASSNPSILLQAEIASAASQTIIVLSTGADVDDTYLNQTVILFDDSNSNYPSIRRVVSYVGATKTLTLSSAPDFTLDDDDSVAIISENPDTAAIKARTDTIVTTSMQVVSTVQGGNTLEIVQGADYTGDGVIGLEWENTSGYDYTSAVATWRAVKTSEYNEGTKASLTDAITMTGLSVDGTTITANLPLTAEQTAALAGAPPLDSMQWVTMIEVTMSGGEKARPVLGAMTVRRGVDGAV